MAEERENPLQKVLSNTVTGASMAVAGITHIEANYASYLGPKAKIRFAELKKQFQDVVVELATMDIRQ